MGPGHIVGDRFQLEAEVAYGGMGSVWRATDREHARPVAVKLLHFRADQHRARFTREGELLATLDHPGIVRYIADGFDGDTPYLVMEWIDAVTLSSRQRSGLTAQESVDVIGRVARALGAAHRKGLVHRDVKPSNILLVDGNLHDPRIVDFGISRWRRGLLGGGNTLGLTRTGTLIGTPGYIAPEQVRGARDVDARADVFALGCVLYECLTGRPAFSGSSPKAMVVKVLFTDPTPIDLLVTGLPRDLTELVAEMIARDPAARPPDGDAVAARLEALLPDSRRPTGRSSEVATQLQPGRAPPADFVAFVVVGWGASEELENAVADVQTDVLPDSFAKRLDTIRALASEHDAMPDYLPDGTTLLRLANTGSAGEQATRAARAALAIAAVFPEASVTVACGTNAAAGSLDALIERAAQQLHDATLLNIFAPTPTANGILICARTAELVGEAFNLRKDGSRTVLLGVA